MKPEDIADTLEDFISGERNLSDGLYSNPDFYDAVYTVDADYDTKENFVRKNLDEGSRILYIGCGTGTLIEKLEDDFEIVGAEPSGKWPREQEEKPRLR